MKQAHIFIHGFVQGVGYRQFVKKHATEFGLVGWVRNTPARNASQSKAGGPDGAVEAVAEGLEEKIKELIELCKKGPFLSEVDDIDVTFEDKTEDFTGFEIRHD